VHDQPANFIADDEREDPSVAGKLIISALSVAALAVVVPTAASARGTFSVTIGSGGYGYNDYPTYGRHDRQHDRIEERHEDGHEQLEEEHEDAHDQGLSRWEHRDVHQDLEYRHARQDYQLQRRHQGQHRRNGWQRRYYNNGYGGYRY